jgi:NAD(P)H dehydrogenase (quinone)
VFCVILVTGATGRVGYRLMERLADAHAEVTAMVRVEAKAADLPGTPRYVVATFDDPPPAEVLRDYDRVFLLSPSNEEQAELETVFIDALVAAGHGPHVVKVAADGFVDPACEVRFMVSHRQVARHLEAVGLPVTYLAPSLYMEGLLVSAGSIWSEGVIGVPAGRGKAGFVAAADVAAVAARVLTSAAPDPGHVGATYVPTGPEALGYADVAARISAVFAREVDYEKSTPARYHEFLLASGMGPWEADGVLELFEWVREGGADTVTADVRSVTGTEPRPLEDWLDDSRASFAEPPDLPPPAF